ncbi:MAG: hypothetical protein A2010_03220 [Nitrospirae bacterium GWD2_57_9]|nr:MAG: hypothetical protein A2010_03220 [Nitrospirae bacterium GWD2_57_9]OGW48625.1 MAG: hypothetical protein A2078_08825 [Nitrospirae bacterium GWC2_57_9]
MKEILRLKLDQAQEALADAAGLLRDGAEPGYIINSIYYAFLYPVLGLLAARNITATMQSTAIALFEREFVQKGHFDQRYMDAIREAFDLKPSCACESPKKVTREDAERLFPLASEFLDKLRQTAA